ncbi:hypothetical protein CSOJ01_00062 [Colletotrichum sojae]|uniref:F-box domain-containing protein n=1 Tax=Colletotrichum sojae TaxID=2175907 RepID=A0A8H6JY21_9PEZI|nr:hypothetical protein CSOJ01_00062 [Colletotrichum sojae]
MVANLPVELVELIFVHSSSPSTIKILRLTCRSFAEIGFPHLFKPEFTYLHWRSGDDARRLCGWSWHVRLRSLLRSLTFNLSQIDSDRGRYLSSSFRFQEVLPEDHHAVLDEGWGEYYDKEARRKLAGSSIHQDAAQLPAAVARFEALERIRLVFNECSYDHDVLRRTFAYPTFRYFEPSQARNTFELLTKMLVKCPHLKALEIDRLLVTIRPSREAEHRWDVFASGIGRKLEELRVALDFTGCGYWGVYDGWGGHVGALLMECWSLKKLAIAKHDYHFSEDHRIKPTMLNRSLLRHNPFRLTDLKLEGFTVSGEELLGFVRLQVSTLKRLRLGGRGIANPRGTSKGGIWLLEGTWFALFSGLKTALRSGKGVLEKMHLEGDFGQSDASVVEGQDLRVFEQYDFYPTTDDKWEPVERPGWLSERLAETALDGSLFETYVLGDEDVPYPGFDY